MNHLFIPSKLASIAKGKQFDVACLAWYGEAGELRFIGSEQTVTNMSDTIKNNPWRSAAPLYQQIIDWFRIKHSVIIQVGYDFAGDFEFDAVAIGMGEEGKFYADTLFMDKDYYKALDQTIEEAFKLI